MTSLISSTCIKDTYAKSIYTKSIYSKYISTRADIYSNSIYIEAASIENIGHIFFKGVDIKNTSIRVVYYINNSYLYLQVLFNRL